jgi:hypothetical protein
MRLFGDCVDGKKMVLLSGSGTGGGGVPNGFDWLERDAVDGVVGKGCSWCWNSGVCVGVDGIVAGPSSEGALTAAGKGDCSVGGDRVQG